MRNAFFACLFLAFSAPLFCQNALGEKSLERAEAFFVEEKYDSAIIHFERSVAAFQTEKNRSREAHALGRLALALRPRNQHDRSIALDLRALSISDSLSDERGSAQATCNLSLDFYYKGEYKTGIEYAEKAIDASRKIGDEALIAISLRNAASSYLFYFPEDKEQGWSSKPGKTAQRETAISYLNKALEIAKRLPMPPIEIGKIQNWRGNVFKYLERIDEAIAAYAEAKSWAKKAGSRRGQNAPTANMAHLLINNDRHEEALPLILEAIAFNEAAHDSLNLVEQYQLAGDCFEKRGDYKKGLEYFEKAMDIQWKTYNRARDVATAELKTKYETEKKEAQIAAQKAEIDQKNKVQWLGFLVLGLLAAGLFQVWRTAVFRKKSNQKLAEANLLLEKKNAENVLLLKEIHHRVKNNLQTISSLLSLQSAHLGDDSAVRGAVEAGQHRVQSMALIHQKLYQRDNLAAIEMRDYLTNLGESLFESYGIDEGRILLRIEMPELELDVDTAVPLGLIVNELVTNSLKHAFSDGRKGMVEIALERTRDGLELRVADDGAGLSKTEKSVGSFGSRLVKLLAMQLGATLEQGGENGFWTRLRMA